jgi:hypothetical protein
MREARFQAPPTQPSPRARREDDKKTVLGREACVPGGVVGAADEGVDVAKTS